MALILIVEFASLGPMVVLRENVRFPFLLTDLERFARSTESMTRRRALPGRLLSSLMTVAPPGT